MNSNKYKTFNQKSNKFYLESDFIIAIFQSDGFSERLLNFGIYIDKDYHFYCEMSSFKGSVLNFSKSFELQIHSVLPNDLKAQISLLLSQKFSQVKEKYVLESLVITDIGSQQILVKIDGETLNINVEGDFRNYDLINKNEKRLEKLLSDLILWIENFYKKIT